MFLTGFSASFTGEGEEGWTIYRHMTHHDTDTLAFLFSFLYSLCFSTAARQMEQHKMLSPRENAQSRSIH